MFTGLVEAVGEIAEIEPASGGSRLRLTTSLAPELANGDSLAVNGVCLTVVSSDRVGVNMDVGPETARITTFGSARPGTIVNLERPLRADARLGGHFVQGHVDGLGTVDAVLEDGGSHWMRVLFPPALAPFMVRKGSIAVDGVSLTLAAVDDRRFDLQIIPYTWTHTNLRTLRAGDLVNLECDILGKYVARSLEFAQREPAPEV